MTRLLRRPSLFATCIALGALGAAAALAQQPAPGQPAPGAGQPAPTPEQARAKAIEDLVVANRILVELGVLDAYGHVSIRVPGDPKHFLMSRSLAPESVTPADILEHDLEGNATPAPGTQLFNERFIHAAVYAARPDVQAVVHNHAPSLIPFGVSGVPLRPLYHMSAFLGAGVPVFDIRAAGGDTDMLVRTLQLGQALAKTLGSSNVALMRGHGAVVVGPDMPKAVFRSIYTEQNARLQAQAMQLSQKVIYLDPEEAKKAEASMAGTIGRPWELWKKKVQAKNP